MKKISSGAIVSTNAQISVPRFLRSLRKSAPIMRIAIAVLTRPPPRARPSRAVISRKRGSRLCRTGSRRATPTPACTSAAFTCAALRWPSGEHDAQLVAVLVDLGDERRGAQRAERAGHIVDGDDQFVARAAGRELGYRALRDDLPAVDDRGRIARLFDLVEQVRGDEHRPPLLLDHRADHLAELLDPARVQPVGRLVEDQQQRVGEQAARDAEPLAHAHRVALDLLVGALAEPDACERGRDPLVGVAATDGRDDAEVLAAAEVHVEARLLDDRADSRERARAIVGYDVAEDAHRARVGGGEAEQRADDRRLAGAVGPRKPNAQPRGTCRSMPSSAVRSPKRLVRPLRLDRRAGISRGRSRRIVYGNCHGLLIRRWMTVAPAAGTRASFLNEPKDPISASAGAVCGIRRERAAGRIYEFKLLRTDPM